MRLIKFITFAALAVCAVSCEKENSSTDIEQLAEAVAGTYVGYSTAEFQYSSTPMVASGQTLTVTEETSETVTLNYTSDTWGTFTVTGTVVIGENGRYEINGNGKTVMGMSADSQSEYDCTLAAEINGTGDYSFVFDVPAVMGGLKITLKPGNPPAGLVVTGTYTGTLNMSVSGSSAGSVEDATVILDASGETTVLTISSFGMGSMTLEDIAVEVELGEASDGSYTLTAESIDTMAGEINVTGSLTGTVSSDGDSMTLHAEIQPGAMPMAITVEFEGTK